MGLRDQVESDIAAILSDTSDCGFGWPVTVRAPSGTTACLVGHSTDIATTIDPDTGMAVSGRTASVALPLCDFQKLSEPVPVGVVDTDKRPWGVKFDDIGGSEHEFRVLEALPDRAAGVVVLLLEAYKWA